jgi:hypothetical protein
VGEAGTDVEGHDAQLMEPRYLSKKARVSLVTLLCGSGQ